ASLGLAKVTSYHPVEDTPQDDTADREAAASLVPPGTWPIYVTIALSGATALAAEAVGTRLLSLLLGATTSTFSLILPPFLIGLGIGSSIGSVVSRTLVNARTALGICQLLLTGTIAWAAYSMTSLLPYWPIDPGLAITPSYIFQIDLVRCLWVVLPAACLWG